MSSASDSTIFIWEVHYKETPKFETLDKDTRDLLINCISINSSYSSQVTFDVFYRYRTYSLLQFEIVPLLVPMMSHLCSCYTKFDAWTTFVQVIPGKMAGEQVTQLGNKTECGMLGFVLGLGQSYQTIRDHNPEDGIFKVRRGCKEKWRREEEGCWDNDSTDYNDLHCRCTHSTLFVRACRL